MALGKRRPSKDSIIFWGLDKAECVLPLGSSTHDVAHAKSQAHLNVMEFFMNKQKINIGHRMAVNRLKKVGVINPTALGHFGILASLFEHNLCGVTKPVFFKKDAQKEFVRIANEAPEIIKEEKESKRFSAASRKLKSTLPRPVVKQRKNDSQPKSVGYKSRCRKDEPLDLNPQVFYNSWRWKEIRLIALDACGRRCGCCGATPQPSNKVVLHVDHIKPLRSNPELALDLSNLQVLCEDCNQGKSWFNTNDYRSDEQREKLEKRQSSSVKVAEDAIARMHDSLSETK